ncbi:DNA polymerase III subunit beta [Peptostreptococcus equinus]|uniref:Beta sliding clamp n=1 Tax=Peptostreptococcus equinus TaxID=3003601 RepID=A0ABY7JNH4_9FIRM|nr:DNA polymerase III subunit beta [Peptostreptococcus sp. CBA3647]WAW14919.1 DNA polymerase III subunit beta [Peptostreptococcus sp. CBA3647]
MNILCNQKKLANAISIAQKAINNRSNVEMFKGLLFSAKGNILTITGYDNEISIKTNIEAQVNTEGDFVVNSRLIGDIIRKLPDTFISIETDDDYNVFVNCANSRFKIKGIASEDFPRQSEISMENMISFDQTEMRNMIRQTVFATANEPINPTLAGELFEIRNNDINMVAVDGYRLAVRKSNIDNKQDSEINVIIPGTTLHHLTSLLTDEGEFYIGVDDKNIIFKLANTQIVARLIEGNFTKYENLLPKEYITKIKIDTRELQNSIERAALLFSGDRNNLIKISVTDKMMVITSNTENGNAYEEIEIEFEGENIEIAFNSRYLLEGIKNIDSERIYMEFGGSVNPCIIKPVDGVEYIYLLLPVRVNN